MNHTTEKQPTAQARRAELVVQELPDEVLVYDLRQHKAHCLNKTAAFLWEHCDGQTTVADLTKLMLAEFNTPMDESMVWHALERLGKAELLTEKIIRPGGTIFRSRRAMLSKLGTAALLSIPLVISVTVPVAVAAASVPAVCQVCINKSAGSCPEACQSLSGTCYNNEGCTDAIAGCQTCASCFGGADPTVSWEFPGVSGCGEP